MGAALDHYDYPSPTTLPIMDAALDHYDYPSYTDSSFPNDSINYGNVSEEISSRNTTDYGSHNSIDDSVVTISIVILVICIFGAVGNGIVIWLLGFRIKRNPFSIYILNLGIADFGVLLAATFLVVGYWVGFIHDTFIIFIVFFFLFLSTYSSSQFLLMAISIDRCVAVFFPLWHRCHRPPHLSTIVCALIWFLSFLLTAITYTYRFIYFYRRNYYQFIVNALLCLPAMTIATAALFIKVCLKARQHRRGKLLSIILLTLLFFLLFAFPLNVMFILHFPIYLSHGALLFAVLNSSVNPAIYILVGRQGKSRQRENMKMAFQKVFKEEESCTEETPVETQL